MAELPLGRLYGYNDFYTQKHGSNIDEYEETEEKKQGGLSAKEYKKKMEQEHSR